MSIRGEQVGDKDHLNGSGRREASRVREDVAARAGSVVRASSAARASVAQISRIARRIDSMDCSSTIRRLLPVIANKFFA
jgi:hypothetical protein